MHRGCKEFSSDISRLITRQWFFLHQFRAKSSRRFIVRDSDKEDDDEISGKEPEIQEGRLHLFKSRGQHLLTNPRVLDTIVRKSNIDPSDTVLEIGPGTGNLTMKLLEAAQRVVAVEIDKRMVERVRNRAAERGFEERLTIMCGDALKAELPRFDLVVANIPYGISSPLVAKLVFGENKFRSATLLLQKEFARRLLANPGESEFNRLSANVKLVAEVEFVMDVSKADFVPIPKVDSSVIKIYPKEETDSVDLNEWLAFTRTCFSNKNKTLGAIFKQKRKLTELMNLSEMRKLNRKAEMHCHSYGTSEDDGMCIRQESDLSSGSDKTMSLFREKVIDILRSRGFEGFSKELVLYINGASSDAERPPCTITIRMLLLTKDSHHESWSFSHCKGNHIEQIGLISDMGVVQGSKSPTWEGPRYNIIYIYQRKENFNGEEHGWRNYITHLQF